MNRRMGMGTVKSMASMQHHKTATGTSQQAVRDRHRRGRVEEPRFAVNSLSPCVSLQLKYVTLLN